MWDGTVSSLAYRQTVNWMTSEGETPPPRPAPMPIHTHTPFVPPVPTRLNAHAHSHPRLSSFRFLLPSVGSGRGGGGAKKGRREGPGEEGWKGRRGRGRGTEVFRAAPSHCYGKIIGDSGERDDCSSTNETISFTHARASTSARSHVKTES